MNSVARQIILAVRVTLRLRPREFVVKGITQLEFPERLQNDIKTLPPLRAMLDDSAYAPEVLEDLNEQQRQTSR